MLLTALRVTRRRSWLAAALTLSASQFGCVDLTRHLDTISTSVQGVDQNLASLTCLADDAANQRAESHKQRAALETRVAGLQRTVNEMAPALRTALRAPRSLTLVLPAWNWPWPARPSPDVRRLEKRIEALQQTTAAVVQALESRSTQVVVVPRERSPWRGLRAVGRDIGMLMVLSRALEQADATPAPPSKPATSDQAHLQRVELEAARVVQATQGIRAVLEAELASQRLASDLQGARLDHAWAARGPTRTQSLLWWAQWTVIAFLIVLATASAIVLVAQYSKDGLRGWLVRTHVALGRGNYVAPSLTSTVLLTLVVLATVGLGGLAAYYQLDYANHFVKERAATPKANATRFQQLYKSLDRLLEDPPADGPAPLTNPAPNNRKLARTEEAS